MNIIIVSIHVVAAVILVLTVLLQAGKGAGMGAAFGGSSGTVFGTRGPATLISKITCAAAIIFMCTSLNMAISQGGLNKGSIMDEYSSEAPAASAPASPAADFAATPAPPAANEAAAPAAEAAPAPTTAE
ncbi:MAG: preprotein translocase subunit SecG [Candidatus Adiutrix sp.]|jgi:preprotein translocase subunit SecG|nr:preprotein translocase subunit SecG [Candidatus Adiutrix sp.]